MDLDERSYVPDVDEPSAHVVPDADLPQNGDWETVADDRGRTYYWNRTTGESAWRLPGEEDLDRPQSTPPRPQPPKLGFGE